MGADPCSSPAAADGPPGTPAPVAGRPPRLWTTAFARVWAGSALSSVSSRTLSVAYPLLALAVDGSPVGAGWVSFALTLPVLLFYIPAGVLADRVDPRSLMLFTEAARGLSVVSVLLALALGRLSLPHMLAAAFLEGTLWVLYTLAETALLPSLVPEGQIGAAMARSETSSHAAVLAGRPLGGLLFGLAPAVPFAVNTALFLGSTLCLLGRTGKARPYGGRRVLRELSGRSLVSETFDGVRELSKHGFLSRATIMTTVTNLMVNALIMIFLTSSAGLSPLEVGLVLAAGGVGGVLGSTLLSSTEPRNAILFTQMWIWVLALALPALNAHPVLFGLATLITGYTGARNNVAVRTYEIHKVDRSKLGRVASVQRLAVYGAVCLAAPFGGFLVAAFGVHNAAVSLFGVMLAVAVAVTIARFLGWVPRFGGGDQAPPASRPAS
ncbi:MFS transporter [Streptosporangium saharense]|uniref:MFS transporter n=1 Tax=Streptosporangium saharense TaxID=1706840 RepID=UPI00342AD489